MIDRLGRHCRQTLGDWAAPDATQERLRLDFLDHLDRVERGWSRDCPDAHLTASALVWARSGADIDSVLLVLHAKLGRWLQTGGHIEPSDDSLAAAALREACEETGLAGLELDPVPLLLSRHEVPACGHHLDVQYLALAPDTDPPVASEESRDVAWFPLDSLPEVDDSVRVLVAAARTRVGV